MEDYNPALNLSTDDSPEPGSRYVDDDGRPRRTGPLWKAVALILTDLTASGVITLGWVVAQLGWVAGPTAMILFSVVTYYTTTLLAVCYRTCHPVTYTDVVRENLGVTQGRICAWMHYLNLFGVAVGYSIAASTSMRAIKRSNCFHRSGGRSPCHVSTNPYMIIFGVAEIIFSQIPEFDQISWLPFVAAVMSFIYSTIGLGLAIARVAENGKLKGGVTGVSTGFVTEPQKIWRSFQALGDIAFAYSYSMVLIEIQDTLKSQPSESKTMKRAALITIVTTIFYMLCGCMGYAAFGDSAPGNLLTGFGFYSPYWLLDIANAAIVIHLIGAYQMYCQPLFAFIEKNAAERFQDCQFINWEIKVPIPGYTSYNLNLFRLVSRTIFVITTTVISMLLPFFNDVHGLLGALGFWSLTVYYPVEMYISQKRIPTWSTQWLAFQVLSGACLIISIAAAAGFVACMVGDVKSYKLFGGAVH